MIIDEEDFDRVWEAAQSESSSSSEKSIVILASINEVDSVCATKIAMVRFVSCARVMGTQHGPSSATTGPPTARFETHGRTVLVAVAAARLRALSVAPVAPVACCTSQQPKPQTIPNQTVPVRPHQPPLLGLPRAHLR